MKGKKIIIILVVSIAFICNVFMYHTFAKYTTKAIQNINTNIANPILELEGGESKQITLTSLETYYDFNVKNYNKDEKINEVDMDYYIEISPQNLEKLDIHLYKEDDEIPLTNYKTHAINLSNTEKQLDSYRLKISFIGNTDTSFIDDVLIKVNSTQKE